MLDQKVIICKSSFVDSIIKTVISELGSKKPSLLLFVTGQLEKFEEISVALKNAFPNIDVVGVTTSGEISHEGFVDKTTIVQALISNRIKYKSILIKDADKYPILQKNELRVAFKEVGLNPDSSNIHHEGFALTFINGLYNFEERVLSVLNSVVKDEKFQIIGGSAGDNLSFRKTFISLNGECIHNGAVVTLFKTSLPFCIHKENIYKPMGKKMLITKADVPSRTVYEIDNKKAVDVYANALGVNKQDLANQFMNHPLGKRIAENIWIASPAQINNDGSISFYCQILPNTQLELMELDDPMKAIHESFTTVQKTVPNIKFLFIVNCILRTLYFKNARLTNYITSAIKQYKSEFCGFSSYGEQIGPMHLNQTMAVLGIGE